MNNLYKLAVVSTAKTFQNVVTTSDEVYNDVTRLCIELREMEANAKLLTITYEVKLYLVQNPEDVLIDSWVIS